MSAPYCLPIIKSAPAEVLATIQANLADYHYFEVWLDYIEQLDDGFVTQLVELLGERLIVLFRRQQLEPIQLPLARRQAILSMLSNTPIGVDLDVTTQQAELEYIKALKLQLITSYHNYETTPADTQLDEIIAAMRQHQPAIYKLSTYCDQRADGLRLLQLLLKLQTDNRTAIVLGMGEQGAITRVFGSLWGNAMIFAPLDTVDQSAPGQLTREQLETIIKTLEN